MSHVDDDQIDLKEIMKDDDDEAVGGGETQQASLCRISKVHRSIR